MNRPEDESLLAHLTATFQSDSHGDGQRGPRPQERSPMLPPEKLPDLGLDSEELGSLTCPPEVPA